MRVRWIRAAVAGVDPALPVAIEAMPDRVGRFRQQPRFLATLVALFAAIGVLLAAVGLYGVLSFQVAQRTREIGVRMALGARPGNVILLVGSSVGLWTAAGVAAGVACSLGAARIAKGLLFGVAPYDPWSLLAAVSVLALTAAVAALAPSRRAARVDPTVALKYE